MINLNNTNICTHIENKYVKVVPLISQFLQQPSARYFIHFLSISIPFQDEFGNHRKIQNNEKKKFAVNGKIKKKTKLDKLSSKRR